MPVRWAYRVAKVLRRIWRPSLNALRRGLLLRRYGVPGERRRCPACGSGGIVHLDPLRLIPPSGPLWRVGFISTCGTCGILFANPLPSDDVLADVYSPGGEWGRDRQHSEETPVAPRRLLQTLAPISGELDVMHPPPGAAVLDVGCGLGGLLDTLADAGWTTYGIDPATKVAFRRHRELTEIPDTPMFDLVVLHHVLEHVTDPSTMLAAVARAVRIGGFAFVSVPNVDGLDQHGDLKYCLRSSTHVMAYTGRCLEWLLATAGFELVSAGSKAKKPRSMNVIGRRVATPVAQPPDAGAAAIRALAHHRAAKSAWMPVRLRAGVLNLGRPRHARRDA